MLKQIKALAVAIACLTAVGSASAVPLLYELAVNIDGVITDHYSYPAATGTVPSSFDPNTGLGTAVFAISGAGAHSFFIFFDHEIDATGYTSETGSTIGAPGAGQSWEIDEPQYFNGDIYNNFASGTLDNGIGTSVFGDTTFPDDVSMALGWGFTLTGTEMASISITASETDPGSGFRLRQHNTVAGDDIFLYGTLTILPGGGGTPGVPEGGATIVTLLVALAGLTGLKLKFR